MYMQVVCWLAEQDICRNNQSMAVLSTFLSLSSPKSRFREAILPHCLLASCLKVAVAQWRVRELPLAGPQKGARKH